MDLNKLAKELVETLATSPLSLNDKVKKTKILLEHIVQETDVAWEEHIHSETDEALFYHQMQCNCGRVIRLLRTTGNQVEVDVQDS